MLESAKLPRLKSTRFPWFYTVNSIPDTISQVIPTPVPFLRAWVRGPRSAEGCICRGAYAIGKCAGETAEQNGSCARQSTRTAVKAVDENVEFWRNGFAAKSVAAD